MCNSSSKPLSLRKMTLVLATTLLLSTPVWATNVLEDFNNDPGGFGESDTFFVSNGRYVFRGDGEANIAGYIAWMGGDNPGDKHPNPNHSNYFTDVEVSVDANLESGTSGDYGYGIFVCRQQNRLGGSDFVSFFTDGEARYSITAVTDGELERFVKWTRSALIVPGDSNTLSIVKNEQQLTFKINDMEVERLSLTGCTGGSVGVTSAHTLDVAFDNFTIDSWGEATTENQPPIIENTTVGPDLPVDSSYSNCGPNNDKPNCGTITILNAPFIEQGEVFDVKYSLKNFNKGTDFDIYVALQLPNGGMLFLQSTTGNFFDFPNFTPEVAPYLSNTRIPDLEGSVLFLDYIPLDIPTGTYRFYAVPVLAGQDVMNGFNWIGELQIAEVTVIPAGY
ncbi:secreted protein [Beggiatoa sp. PS]|nr:secreted protein [Beggiatoa sp. PS]